MGRPFSGEFLVQIEAPSVSKRSLAPRPGGHRIRTPDKVGSRSDFRFRISERLNLRAATLPIYLPHSNARGFAGRLKEFQMRNNARAILGAIRTTRVKGTTRRRIDRRRRFPAEHDVLSLLLALRIGNRNGAYKRFCVGMRRMIEHAGCRTQFDNSAQIHDGDSIRDVFDDARVVQAN